MDTRTIASSGVVPDTAGFPHGSLGLADVIDPVADIKNYNDNEAIEKSRYVRRAALLRASGDREWVIRKGRAADRFRILCWQRVNWDAMR
jgi:hypothetical protein